MAKNNTSNRGTDRRDSSGTGKSGSSGTNKSGNSVKDNHTNQPDNRPPRSGPGGA